MRRWQVAVVSAGCVAALLLLWLSVAVDPTWQWWLRGAAVGVIPLCFFAAIATGMARDATRAERGVSPEEVQRRRRAAWGGVASDVAPLATSPGPLLRPFARAWELWRSHPLDGKRRPPTDGDTPAR